LDINLYKIDFRFGWQLFRKQNPTNGSRNGTSNTNSNEDTNYYIYVCTVCLTQNKQKDSSSFRQFPKKWQLEPSRKVFSMIICWY
jgi:hypothetical protein